MIRRCGFLLLGLFGAACFLVLAILSGGHFSLIEHNRQTEVEADAYFYSELGDLNDFLDSKNGKYALRHNRPNAIPSQ